MIIIREREKKSMKKAIKAFIKKEIETGAPISCVSAAVFCILFGFKATAIALSIVLAFFIYIINSKGE